MKGQHQLTGQHDLSGQRHRRRTPASALAVAALAVLLAACSTTAGQQEGSSAPSASSSARDDVSTTAGPSASTPTASQGTAASAGTATSAPDRAVQLRPSAVITNPGSTPPEPSTTPETTAPAPTTAPETGFAGTVSEIDSATTTRMGSSWHLGCPVPLSDLRYLTVTYRGFDGADHDGELVVEAGVAADVIDIFRQLYDADFPIASMRLVDDFGGSDDDSMAADNSSAFNCRPVTGGGGFSEHSYGTAIDLNPVENPYLSGSLVLPTAGRTFVDRPDAPGVIHPGDAVVEAFASHGWTWGGTWSGPIDYQHFSVSGR
jgi:hypothetical protein